jgi:multimeric flavodoxin WrbA
MSVTVAVIYHSSFRGNVARLAASVAAGAASVEGASVRQIAVETVDDHWQYLQDCDAILLGCPTYVGSVSARFKEFIESLAGQIWLERLWLNKVAGGFTCSAGRGGDKFNCMLDLVVAAAQMGMIWVPMPMTGGNYSTEGSEDDLNRMAGYLGVMAQANIDQTSEDAPPLSDLRTAEIYGRHVTEVAAALRAGGVRKTAALAPARPWRMAET